MSHTRATELVLHGRYREALNELDSEKHPSEVGQALRAWVELEIGQPSRARTQSEALARHTADHRAKAFALLVAGKALSRCGPPEQGLAQMRKAISLVEKIDPSLEAEFRAQLLNSVFWIGIEPALAELPQLKHSAIRTGNRNAFIEYHLAQARVAALRNLHAVAASEIELAGDLLSAHNNLDQLWRLREMQANLAVMNSQMNMARKFAELCLLMGDEMGLGNRVAYTQGNLAHICACIGDFATARRLVVACSKGLPAMSRARLASLSTEIQIGLATGDIGLADQAVSEGLTALEHAATEESYYRLWFDLFHTRWLLARARPQQALKTAGDALNSAPRLADTDLEFRLRLLRIEALFALGQQSEAERDFLALAESMHTSSLEVIADTMRVAALLSAPLDRLAAGNYLRTASELLNSAGLLGSRAEMLAAAEKAGITTATHGESAWNLGFTGNVVNALALVLRLGRHPAVLGEQLASLVRQQYSSEIVVSEEKVDSQHKAQYAEAASLRREEMSETSWWIRLGEEAETVYYLRGQKPTSVAEAMLWNSLRQIVNAASALLEQTHGRDLAMQPAFEGTPNIQAGMIVAAEASAELLNTTRKLAPSNITVLITGETGTGKELLAKALHDASPRAASPFIPFNCSAVSRDMLGAQLFGYRKGAFTGANDAFDGVIRAAAGGTLFLDEIGEVALDVQPKLLRFLESGEIHPLGEPRPLHVDVRVVAATNADLEQMVDEGRFREDLFYRLNVVRLQVPPLRERREEIPPIVQHYLDRFSREAQKTGLRIADETLEYLILYNWPGNVRQLANEVRRMVALTESGAVLMPEHLSDAIASSRRTVPTGQRPLAPIEFVVRVDQPLSAAVEHVERSMIQYALKLSGGHMEDAAQRLGLSRKGLYLKRQRLGIADAEPEPALEAR